jgi:hypothetical protein
MIERNSGPDTRHQTGLKSDWLSRIKLAPSYQVLDNALEI